MFIKADLLTIEQLCGNYRLKIIDMIKNEAIYSDYSRILGVSGCYWTKSSGGDNNPNAILNSGYDVFGSVIHRDIGVRVAFSYSEIEPFIKNKRRDSRGFLTFEFGEFLGKAVSEEESKILTQAFIQQKMTIVGKGFTRDMRGLNKIMSPFKGETQPIYEYNGKKYCRVKATFNDDQNLSRGILSPRGIFLPSGIYCHNGDYVWLEVSPMICYKDIDTDVCFTKDVVFAGVQFTSEGIYKGDFEATDMYWYLNNIFLKEILQFETLDKEYLCELEDCYLKLIELIDISKLSNKFSKDEYIILEMLKRDLNISKIAQDLNISQIVILKTLMKLITLYRDMFTSGIKSAHYKIKCLTQDS